MKNSGSSLDEITGHITECVTFLSSRALRTYAFCRRKNPANYLKLMERPKVVGYSKEEIADIEEDFAKMIAHFEHKIVTEMPYVNLDIFNRNLKTLKILPIVCCDDLESVPFGIWAFYDSNINTLYVENNKNILSYIYHELLHVAHTVYDKKNKRIYTGFAQADLIKDIEVGRGLGEGYTQFLNERYFTRASYKSYPFEVCYAAALEKILSRRIMGECLFTANLKRLVNSLARYAEFSEIWTFLQDLDYVHENYTKINMTYKTGDLIHNKTRSISLFLIKCYKRKLIIKRSTGLLSQEEAYQRLESFVYEMKYSHSGDLMKFETVFNEDIFDALDEGFENIDISKNTKRAI